MTKIKLDLKRLDDTVKEEMVELQGQVFAVIPLSDRGRPAYTIFIKQDTDRLPLPLAVQEIPHERGGGHGDVRLRFNCGNLIIMLLSDYERSLHKDSEFIDACAILYDGEKFVKGNSSELKRYGAYITRD